MMVSRLGYFLSAGLLADVVLLVANNILIQFGFFDRHAFTISMNLVVLFSGSCALLFFRSRGLNWFGNLLPQEHPVNKYGTQLFAVVPLLISIFFAAAPWLQKFSN